MCEPLAQPAAGRVAPFGEGFQRGLQLAPVAAQVLQRAHPDSAQSLRDALRTGVGFGEVQLRDGVTKAGQADADAWTNASKP
ncbi:MAG: hypothetical protein U1F50_21450 [Rubrivivax sp.]